ncbi:MAG: hypothetical protein WEB13_09030 [Dehalococcoidia bacterium]
MEVAEKILITGGLLLLLFAFFTGFLLGRAREHALTGPKYLILSHMEPLMQGTLMLALVWAVRLSDLDGRLEALAASLMVAAASIQGSKELLNHYQGVVDEFAQRPHPIGWYGARIQSPMASVGLVIFVVGVLRAL